MKKIFSFPLALMLLVSCSPKQQQQKESPIVQVTAAELFKGDKSRTFAFISQPYNETELSFRVGGPLQKFDIQSGTKFHKGETLVRIDDRDFLINKERTEAIFTQTEAEYKRVAVLYEKDNISGSIYEKARAEYASAKTAYESAMNALKDTRLVVPFDGYVQQLFVEPFQEVKVSQPVVSLIDMSRLKLEIYVPEDMTVMLREQVDRSCIRITFDALPDKLFVPEEFYLSQSTTKNNLSYLLTVVMNNRAMNLPGGMRGTVLITMPDSGQTTTEVTIPQTAVCNNRQLGDFVWKINSADSTVHATPIKVQNIRGNKAIVNGGISAGDIIACTRLSFLSEGGKVNFQ